MIQALHVLEQGDNLVVQLGDQGFAVVGRTAMGRVKPSLEQRQDGAGHGRVFAQGGFLHGLRRVEARLLAIAGQGADQGRLAPMDAQFQHQAIKAVALCAAGPDRREGGFEGRLYVGKRQGFAAWIFQQEVVDIDRRVAGRADDVVRLFQRLQPHVGQDRQDVGQGDGRAATIEFEAELQRAFVRRAEGADSHRLGMDAVPG